MKRLFFLFAVLSIVASILSACSNKCTVTFLKDGEEYLSVSIKEGERLDEPAAPEKQGYVFMGWSYLGEEWSFDSTVQGDMTLEAVFVDEKTAAFGDNFEFVLSADESFYILMGIGGCKSPDALIPESYNGLPVKEIGAFAFKGSFITSVTIPSAVEAIGEGAFSECKALKSFTVAEGNSAYKSIDGSLYSKDGSLLVAYATASTRTEFTVPNGVLTIGKYAFAHADRLEKVILSDSLKEILDYAFYASISLRTVEVVASSQLTTIGASAFSTCAALEGIFIPDSVSTIDSFAFYSCKALREVDFSKNSLLTKIGDYAFSFCDALEAFNYDGTIKKFNTFVTLGEENSVVLSLIESNCRIGSYSAPVGAWTPTREYEGITYATWKSEEDYLSGKPPVTFYTTFELYTADVGAKTTVGDVYRDPNYIPGYVHLFANVAITEAQVTFGQTQKVTVNLGGYHIYSQQGFRVGGTDGSRKEASVTLKNGTLTHVSGQIQPRADSTLIFENVVFNADISTDIFYGLCCELTVFKSCEIYINGGGSFMMCGRWDYKEGDRNTLRFENSDVICTGDTPYSALFFIRENPTYESLWDIVFDGSCSIAGKIDHLVCLKEARTGTEVHPFSGAQTVTFLDGFVFRGECVPYSTYQFIKQDGEGEIELPTAENNINDGLLNIRYGEVIVESKQRS